MIYVSTFPHSLGSICPLFLWFSGLMYPYLQSLKKGFVSYSRDQVIVLIVKKGFAAYQLGSLDCLSAAFEFDIFIHIQLLPVPCNNSMHVFVKSCFKRCVIVDSLNGKQLKENLIVFNFIVEKLSSHFLLPTFHPLLQEKYTGVEMDHLWN